MLLPDLDFDRFDCVESISVRSEAQFCVEYKNGLRSSLIVSVSQIKQVLGLITKNDISN